MLKTVISVYKMPAFIKDKRKYILIAAKQFINKQWPDREEGVDILKFSIEDGYNKLKEQVDAFLSYLRVKNQSIKEIYLTKLDSGIASILRELKTTRRNLRYRRKVCLVNLCFYQKTSYQSYKRIEKKCLTSKISRASLGLRLCFRGTKFGIEPIRTNNFNLLPQHRITTNELFGQGNPYNYQSSWFIFVGSQKVAELQTEFQIQLSKPSLLCLIIGRVIIYLRRGGIKVYQLCFLQMPC